MTRTTVPLPRGGQTLRIAAVEGRVLLQLVAANGLPGSALVLPLEAAQDVARALSRLARAAPARRCARCGGPLRDPARTYCSAACSRAAAHDRLS